MAYLLPQIPKEKLLTALERVLVDVTNKVGVDINRAVTDSYYQRLLPFISGLGPRKAQVLVKKIASIVRLQYILLSSITDKRAPMIRVATSSTGTSSSRTVC